MLRVIAKCILSVPSSALIFISGILTSISANQFTSISSLFGINKLDISAEDVHLLWVSAAILVIGVGVFILGSVSEQASRRADFVRDDHTSQDEYEIVTVAYFSEHRAVVMGAIFLIITGLLLCYYTVLNRQAPLCALGIEGTCSKQVDTRVGPDTLQKAVK